VTPTLPHPAPIATERLSRTFGRRAALHNVSLAVERGTTCGLIGLIGLNGAGKSTLIRAAVGLLPPTSGVVRINSVDIWTDRVSAIATLGYVPDRPNTYPWMRVREAIDFAAKAWGPAWNNVLAENLLRQYGLDPRQRCGKLSKGQGAKLSLLLALAHDPAILILDEPTDGLDPIARDEFLQQVLESTLEQNERSAGRTVLISSHALGELQRLTDTIAVLHEGTLLVQAPTAELLANTKRLRVVLDGADQSVPLPATPQAAICQQRRGREWTVTVTAESDEAARRLQGAPNVSSISVENLSLDEVFKDLIRGCAPAPEGASC
jgi:ABC-2 type transport system ATP-binding protein